MYGAQARYRFRILRRQFENDVEMYGAQAESFDTASKYGFENDVEMYGAQTGQRLLDR